MLRGNRQKRSQFVCQRCRPSLRLMGITHTFWAFPSLKYIQKTCIKLRKTAHDPQHDRLRGSCRGSARRLPHGRPAQRQSSVPRPFDPAARRASRARVRVTRAPGSGFEARQGRMQDFAQSGTRGCRDACGVRGARRSPCAGRCRRGAAGSGCSAAFGR